MSSRNAVITGAVVVIVAAGGTATYLGMPRDTPAESSRPVIVPNIEGLPDLSPATLRASAQSQSPPSPIGESSAAIRAEPVPPPPSRAADEAAPALAAQRPLSPGDSPAREAKAERPAAVTNAMPPVSESSPSPPRHAKTSTAGAGAQPPFELELKATSRQVWVWISRDEGPREAVSLERGQTARFRAENGFVLTVDDAGGIEATLNGQSLPSFGAPAQARRNITIPSPETSPIG